MMSDWCLLGCRVWVTPPLPPTLYTPFNPPVKQRQYLHVYMHFLVTLLDQCLLGCRVWWYPLPPTHFTPFNPKGNAYTRTTLLLCCQMPHGWTFMAKKTQFELYPCRSSSRQWRQVQQIKICVHHVFQSVWDCVLSRTRSIVTLQDCVLPRFHNWSLYHSCTHIL